MLGAGELVFNGGTVKVWEDKNILEMEMSGYTTLEMDNASVLCT